MFAVVLRRCVMILLVLGSLVVVSASPSWIKRYPQRPDIEDLPSNVMNHLTDHPQEWHNEPNHAVGMVMSNSSSEDMARFFSLLTVVRIENLECESGSGLRGRCYPGLECTSLGGYPEGGSCGGGFGVCCLFRLTCSGVTNINGSYFESPEFPQSLSGNEGTPEVCWLDVHLAGPEIKQLRLDLEVFELRGPTKGDCIQDMLMVSGQEPSSPVPLLCGINTGQHVYVEIGNSGGPVRLSVVVTGTPPNQRRWRIRVTQLRAKDEPLAAPSHCLQYYTEPVGMVQSFNYMGGGYTNNLNYAVCIRKQAGICSVTYRNFDYSNKEYKFQLVNVDGLENLVPPNQAGAGVFNCPDDYIVVGGIRLCGEKLNDATMAIDFFVNAPVTDSSTGPFILPMRTNRENTGLGFNLVYNQNPCT